MSRTPNCVYVTPDGWMTPEHRNDCNHPNCPGCRPCDKHHCAAINGCPNHIDYNAGLQTCPACIGKVRRTLATINRLYAIDLPIEALNAGVNSEAVNLLGPAVPGVGPDERRGWCEWPLRNDHPLIVLGDWDLSLRDHYGPRTDLTITVPRAVAYFDNLLNGPFPHGEQFVEFAKSIRGLLAHMEAVLHDSHAPEKGAPCPECTDGARLVKRYGPTEADDAWHCPNNPGTHSWTNTDYWNRIEGEHLNPNEWMNATQAAAHLGIEPATLRMRAVRRPKGRQKWKGGTLYSVKVLAS